jgi:S-adenosylmethionine:tRNA ribosyltransferase-isomerase
VAAPTAGLHFDDDLLARLEAQGNAIQRVTLHVGLGTFRPIKTERLTDHVMHAEQAEISAATVAALQQARAAGDASSPSAPPPSAR